MQNALIELVEQKKFDEITISDICRLAGVNRSTFYAHYSNKVELLEEAEQE
ncbi:MAG TPA: TetR family transcriptional regulator, partial [Treponema sp.]|nr:TetR family transcriptional regulator [Treponema sp.]